MRLSNRMAVGRIHPFYNPIPPLGRFPAIRALGFCTKDYEIPAQIWGTILSDCGNESPPPHVTLGEKGRGRRASTGVKSAPCRPIPAPTKTRKELKSAGKSFVRFQSCLQTFLFARFSKLQTPIPVLSIRNMFLGAHPKYLDAARNIDTFSSAVAQTIASTKRLKANLEIDGAGPMMFLCRPGQRQLVQPGSSEKVSEEETTTQPAHHQTSSASAATRIVPRRLITVAQAYELADGVRQLRPHPTPPDQNIDPEAVALGFVYSSKGTIQQVLAVSSRARVLFKIQEVGLKAVLDALRPLLEDESVPKVVHNVCAGGLRGLHVANTLDTQLAYEHLTGAFAGTLEQAVAHFPDISIAVADYDEPRNARRSSDSKKASELQFLPIIDALRQVYPSYVRALGPESLPAVLKATTTRAAHPEGQRSMCLDTNHPGQLRSHELLSLTQPDAVSAISPSSFDHSAVEALLARLPRGMQSLAPEHLPEVRDVILDLGKRPCATVGTKRVFLNPDPSVLVTVGDIRHITRGLSFGADNRTALPDHLFRISAIRNRSGGIIALTLRAGRPSSGAANLVSDLVAQPRMSILFLGPPGTGKTTVIREVARLLAELQNVVIVDTSNEIAGDSDISHECIGAARRMMVPPGVRPQRVMVECVQNHCPDTIVIDEIGRYEEVEAARTIKHRGVRLIASAHGSLRELNLSDSLRGLLGTFQDSILTGGTPQTSRTSLPVFDCIVELKKESMNDWVVISPVDAAVDALLQGRSYHATRRRLDPSTGLMTLTPITG